MSHKREQWLDLSYTMADDDVVKTVARALNLRGLNLRETGNTDHGLPAVKSMHSLSELSVAECGIGEEGRSGTCKFACLAFC